MKLAWLKFYPADWRADPALRMCSMGARGLWMEMLALMHIAEPRGYLVHNNEKLSIKQLSALAGCSTREADGWISELSKAGVFSQDHAGTIYSRRMVRDIAKEERDRSNGKTGGNPELKKGVNPPDKAVVNVEDKAQNLEARNQNISTLKRACPKRVRTRIGYSEEFLTLWREYPVDALMSKKLAFEAWQRLSDEDRELVIKSVPAFKAHCRANPDYRPVHLVRYVTQRRFEGFVSISVVNDTKVFVKCGTPQFDAWDEFYRAKQGTGAPHMNGGWRFPSEWPPVGVAA